MIWRIFYQIVLVPLGWMFVHLLGLFDKKRRWESAAAVVSWIG